MCTNTEVNRNTSCKTTNTNFCSTDDLNSSIRSTRRNGPRADQKAIPVLSEKSATTIGIEDAEISDDDEEFNRTRRVLGAQEDSTHRDHGRNEIELELSIDTARRASDFLLNM